MQLFAENNASVAKVKELGMSFSTEVAKNEIFIKVIEKNWETALLLHKDQ